MLGESKRRKSSQFPNCFSSQAGTLSKEKEPEKRHEGGNEACLTRDRRYEGWQVLQTDQTAGSQPENLIFWNQLQQKVCIVSHLVGAEIYDLDVGKAELLDAGDLVVVEAKDLEVGEVLQAGAVEVGQVVVRDVQRSEGGREGCQELMDSCQVVKVRMDTWKVYALYSVLKG